jgi:UDP-N-acetylmuramoyl-L-alanyl-D-glutamate--2,6-diaminopimelate ligase
MAKLAESHCRHIILTDEDPYDEDPKKIVEEMARAISIPKYEIIMDRRQAIRAAFKEATAGDVVLLTGKGTDPYIMGPNDSKQEWSDARVAREELRKVVRN